MGYFINFFGWPVTPCGDCCDDQCTMNCSTAMKPNPHQAHGEFVIFRKIEFPLPEHKAWVE